MADPDPGSDAFLTLGPGSGIRNRYLSGSRIPNPYFGEVSDILLGKKFYNSLKTYPNFFSSTFQNKIIFNFVKFVATKKDMKTNFFTLLFCCYFLDPESGIGKNQDPG